MTSGVEAARPAAAGAQPGFPAWPVHADTRPGRRIAAGQPFPTGELILDTTPIIFAVSGIP